MGTTTLLQLKSKFWEYQGALWSGTISSACSSLYAADSSLQDLPDDALPWPVEGQYIYITAGDSAGDVRRIVKFDPATGRMDPNRPFTTAVTSSSTYEIWGTSIHPADQLTRLFRQVLTYCRPVEQTRLSPTAEGRRWYDVTQLVESPSDILRVWVRTIDTSYLRPFSLEYISQWRVHTMPVHVRTVAITGSPEGGSYSLTYNSTAATSALAYNTPSSTFQNSMRALTGSTSLSVASSGTTPNFVHTITHYGIAGTPWDLVAYSSLLTGGSSPTVTVAEGTGIPGIFLEIEPDVTEDKLTSGSTSMSQKELWMEHHKTLASFADDTSTVDSRYADWLVWEAILAHAVERLSSGGDAARWKNLAERAKRFVQNYRARFVPRRGGVIRHERPQYT